MSGGGVICLMMFGVSNGPQPQNSIGGGYRKGSQGIPMG